MSAEKKLPGKRRSLDKAAASLTATLMVTIFLSDISFADEMLTTAMDKALRVQGVNVIPCPAMLEAGAGTFTLTAKTTIRVGAGTEQIGLHLSQALSAATGFQLKVLQDDLDKKLMDVVGLSMSGDAGQLGEEGYELQVLTNRVLIKAASPAGVFYGCQTLRQLFPARIESRIKVQGTDWITPVVRIVDRPQFVWRGLMLDPARHFISTQGILKCLDWMSCYKLNRLHLHLTDVDGWRIEIKKYPRLTKVGAWTDLGQGIERGGFYTRSDIQKIVAYAAERFITVIPEIETPSHSGAAMVAYPELNCFGTRRSNALFGVDPLCGSEYCAGNDRVFEFLDGVIAEVAQMFPGPYLHVGGDEAEMRYWADCPKCQERRKKVGDLQAWFMGRVKSIASRNGKQIIGWGGVAPGAVFTCWDADGTGGWNAAKNGWDVIMSTGNNHYLNFNIERTSLKNTYDFDPAPASASLTPLARRHMLGVEGCLWGEMVPENHIESQVFPRVLALAERAWGIGHYDYDDFLERVKVQVNRLAVMGILTGPAYGYTATPAIPARVRNALPSLIYSASQNQNDEDWRWALTGIDKGQGHDALVSLQAFDGDLETYYLSWGPRKDVDTFTIMLEKPEVFDRIQAITGLANGDHILRQGVLEVSRGYGRWKPVARFSKGVAAAALDKTPVVAFRLRSTIDQSPFDLLAVREFILEKEGKTTLKQFSPVERLRLPTAIAK